MPGFSERLDFLKLEAPNHGRGSVETLHTVLKFPTATIVPENQDKELQKLWNDWWKCTTAATTTTKIKWNSCCRKSQIWLNFGEAADAITGHPYVFCIQCGVLLQHPNYRGSDTTTHQAIGVSHLTNHRMSKSCRRVVTPVHSQSTENNERFLQPRRTIYGSRIPVFSSDAFEQELVRVVIDGNWSFRTVERLSFQRFIQFLRPDTVITSRYKFSQMFQRQFDKHKARQLEDLGDKTKISFALDAWSADSHLSFLAIKGYYINNNWRLREVLVDFIPIRGRHTGESMATEVFQVLESTKKLHRFLALTCDNAGNNGTLARSLQEKLQIENIEWEASENTIPCLAHIINIVVQEIIQHLKLAPSQEMEEGETLQRRHVYSIEHPISVPNSLRKVALFITRLYHILTIL